MSGELNMGSNKIVSLATPINDTDASTKKYVDDSHSVNPVNPAHASANTLVFYTSVSTPNTNGYHSSIEPTNLISPKKIIMLKLGNFA